jgi:hypothetical protein
MRIRLLGSVALSVFAATAFVASAQERQERGAPAEKSQPAQAQPAPRAQEPRPAAQNAPMREEAKPSAAAREEPKGDSMKPGQPAGNQPAAAREEHEPKGSTTRAEQPSKNQPSSAAKEEPRNGSIKAEQPAKNQPAAAAKDERGPNGKAPANANNERGNATTPTAAEGRPANANEKSAGAAANGGPRDTAAAANIKPEQRDKIVSRLGKDREARTDVKFDVGVGVVVPERVKFRPLPTDIVEIAPEYRGYDYVVVSDEIVIVEPRTRKVVTVLNEGGGSGVHHAALTISADRKSAIHRDVLRDYRGPREERLAARVGEHIPDGVRLMTFSDAIFADDADLRGYEYIVYRDEVLVVDPRTREIVDILE